MSTESSQNMLTETAYKTEAWQYRHAIVRALIFFFSIFFLIARASWGAISGFYHGIVNGWTENVKPFMSASLDIQRTPTDASHNTQSGNGANA